MYKLDLISDGNENFQNIYFWPIINQVYYARLEHFENWGVASPSGHLTQQSFIPGQLYNDHTMRA